MFNGALNNLKEVLSNENNQAIVEYMEGLTPTGYFALKSNKETQKSIKNHTTSQSDKDMGKN